MWYTKQRGQMYKRQLFTERRGRGVQQMGDSSANLA